MRAIQPMDVTTFHPATATPGSTSSPESEAGHPFAQVMRSAVTAQPTGLPAPTSSHPSDASASKLSSCNRTSQSASSLPSQPENQGSNSSSLDRNGDASSPRPDLPAETAASSSSANSSAATLNGEIPSLTNGQVQASIVAAIVGNRSIETTSLRGRGGAASTSETDRKQTGTGKKAAAGGSVSNSSAVAIPATTDTVSVSTAMTITPVYTVSTATPVDPAAATQATPRTKPIGDSTSHSLSPLPADPANQSAWSTSAPRGGETTGKPSALPNAAGISAEGKIASHTSALSRGSEAVDSRSDVPPVADGSRNVDSAGNSRVPGPSLESGAVASTTSRNGSANAAGQAGSASSVNPGGSDNSGSGRKDAAGDAGHGSPSPEHANEGSSRTDFTPTPSPSPTSANNLPMSHANLPDASVGSQNGVDGFSAGSHPGAASSVPSSATALPAARASAADAFAALDSATVGERGVLLHAAPHQVAVGVSDPSLGWVEVRAERVSGQIAAALTASSAASHETLTSVLPTMATYLQEHRAGVHQVHVETSLSGGQAGTGSQADSSPQNHARSAADSTAVADAVTPSRHAAPAVTLAAATNRRNGPIQEGHYFSIRA